MNYPEPIWLDETTSTNSYLAELCDTQTCPELTSVYTAYQSAGRGQRGNSWESEAGANLLFSFVVYPEFLEARRQFLLSQITALALQEILSLYTEDIRIKWPNDIYWKDKKLCGTLIENDLTGTHIGRSISGTGVNLNQEQFISDAPNPVSLFQITGKRYDRRVILEQFMERAEAYYERLKAGEDRLIASRYKEHLYRKDGFHAYRDGAGNFCARILDVEPMADSSWKIKKETEEDTCSKKWNTSYDQSTNSAYCRTVDNFQHHRPFAGTGGRNHCRPSGSGFLHRCHCCRRYAVQYDLLDLRVSPHGNGRAYLTSLRTP